jgi:hypothetical protein
MLLDPVLRYILGNDFYVVFLLKLLVEGPKLKQKQFRVLL